MSPSANRNHDAKIVKIEDKPKKNQLFLLLRCIISFSATLRKRQSRAVQSCLSCLHESTTQIVFTKQMSFPDLTDTRFPGKHSAPIIRA